MAAPSPTNGTSLARDDYWNSPDYAGHREIATNAILLAISTVLVTIRLYIRIAVKKSPGLDDAFCVAALLSLAAMFAVDTKTVQYGGGAHIKYVPLPLLLEFFKWQPAVALVYMWVIAMVRLSVLTFIPRLGRTPWVDYALYTLAVLIVAETTAGIAYKLTMCDAVGRVFQPASQTVGHCKPPSVNNDMMIGHGAAGIFIDFWLLVLPLYVVCSKAILSRTTVQALLVLGVGLFVLVTGIVRVVLIKTLNLAGDLTYLMGVIGVWSNIETNVGLWCCCFPALQPLLRGAAHKLGFRSTGSTSRKESASHASGGNNNNNNNNGDNNVIRTIGHRRSLHRPRDPNAIDTDSDDNNSERRIVGDDGKDDAAVELQSLGGSANSNHISRTTEVEVTITESHVGGSFAV